ncbi:hypothetical protein SNEBB_001801 [Seison nebaliae]|nr:hypothetical protein SNEBB_001801 [Seison nebaliae]
MGSDRSINKSTDDELIDGTRLMNGGKVSFESDQIIIILLIERNVKYFSLLLNPIPDRLVNLHGINLVTYQPQFEAQDDFTCHGKRDGYYTDPLFCHVYWRCSYGVAEEYECPAGTAWNHLSGRCDWLDNVDCERKEEAQSSDEYEEEYDYVEDDDEEGEEENEKKSENLKKNIDTDESPSEIDIDEKRRKEQNISDVAHGTEKTVIVTDLFSQSTKLLLINDQSNSSLEIIDSDKLDEKQKKKKKRKETTKKMEEKTTTPRCSEAKENPMNCDSYYDCIDGRYVGRTCPKGYLFDTYTFSCNEKNKVYCGNRKYEKDPCENKSNGIHADEASSCRIFYECSNRRKTREAKCNIGYRFNGVIGRCDLAANVPLPCSTLSLRRGVQIPKNSSTIKTISFFIFFVNIAFLSFQSF